MDDKEKPQSGSQDVSLSKEITIDGAKVKALRMREPTVADQLANDAAKGGDVEKELQLIANLCMVKPQDLHQLTLRDYKKLQNTLVRFLD